MGGMHWTRCLHPEDRERVLVDDARSDGTANRSRGVPDAPRTGGRCLGARRGGPRGGRGAQPVLARGPHRHDYRAQSPGRPPGAPGAPRPPHRPAQPPPVRRPSRSRARHDQEAGSRRRGAVHGPRRFQGRQRLPGSRGGGPAAHGRRPAPREMPEARGHPGPLRGRRVRRAPGGVEDPGEAVRVARRIADELRRPVRPGRPGAVRLRQRRDLLRHGPHQECRRTSSGTPTRPCTRPRKSGGGFRVFDPAMYERVVRRLELENDLQACRRAG